MVKVLSFLLLVSAVQAFSLGGRVRDSRLAQRTTAENLATFTSKLQHSQPTFLQQTVTADAQVEVVAASTKSKSLIDMVWNEDTKLAFYLAVWYLGNIYYNIYNKKACIALGKNAAGHSNAHWALSAAQVFFFRMTYYRLNNILARNAIFGFSYFFDAHFRSTNLTHSASLSLRMSIIITYLYLQLVALHLFHTRSWLWVCCSSCPSG